MEVLRPKVNGTMESSAIGAGLFLSVVEKCLIDVPFHFLQQRHHRFFSRYLITSFFISWEIPQTRFSVNAFLSNWTTFTGQPCSMNSWDGFMPNASAMASIVSADGNFDWASMFVMYFGLRPIFSERDPV